MQVHDPWDAPCMGARAGGQHVSWLSAAHAELRYTYLYIRWKSEVALLPALEPWEHLGQGLSPLGEPPPDPPTPSLSLPPPGLAATSATPLPAP